MYDPGVRSPFRGDETEDCALFLACCCWRPLPSLRISTGSGRIHTPNGPAQVGFTFKADDTTLTGSTTGPDGNVVPIKNGKVDGNKISFTVDLDFGGMPFTLAYTGVVSPEQVKLTADFAGMPFEFVVKKSN